MFINTLLSVIQEKNTHTYTKIFRYFKLSGIYRTDSTMITLNRNSQNFNMLSQHSVLQSFTVETLQLILETDVTRNVTDPLDVKLNESAAVQYHEPEAFITIANGRNGKLFTACTTI